MTKASPPSPDPISVAVALDEALGNASLAVQLFAGALMAANARSHGRLFEAFRIEDRTAGTPGEFPGRRKR